MSFLKDLFGGDDKNKPKPTSVESQLPEKKTSTIFPYLKFSGDGDAKPGDVFKIEDDNPIIATSYFKVEGDSEDKKMEIICKKILPDCFLFYGFDLDTMFVQVMPSDFNASLRLDNIHLVAKENLTYFSEHEKVPEIRSSESGINMIVCGGNYEASLILFEDIWLNLQEQLASVLYVSIPARDMVLFTTKDNLVAIDEIRKLVTDQYYTYHRQMSKYLYKVEGDIWTVVEKIID
jgi:hypothetical protein